MALEGKAAALEALAGGRGAVVWQRLIADIETPVSAALKLIEPGRGDWVLESVESGETRGRYSLLGLDPESLGDARLDHIGIDQQHLKPALGGERDGEVGGAIGLALARMGRTHEDAAGKCTMRGAGIREQLGLEEGLSRDDRQRIAALIDQGETVDIWVHRHADVRLGGPDQLAQLPDEHRFRQGATGCPHRRGPPCEQEQRHQTK